MKKVSIIALAVSVSLFSKVLIPEQHVVLDVSNLPSSEEIKMISFNYLGKPDFLTRVGNSVRASWYFAWPTQKGNVFTITTDRNNLVFRNPKLLFKKTIIDDFMWQKRHYFHYHIDYFSKGGICE